MKSIHRFAVPEAQHLTLQVNETPEHLRQRVGDESRWTALASYRGGNFSDGHTPEQMTALLALPACANVRVLRFAPTGKTTAAAMTRFFQSEAVARLTALALYHFDRLGIQAMRVLAKTALTALLFDMCAIKPPALQALLNEPLLTPLRYLNLFGCKLRDAGVEVLAAARPALQTLILNRNQCSDAAAKALAPLKGLHHLQLRDNYLTDEGAKALAGENLAEINHLDVSYNRLTDAGTLRLLAATRAPAFISVNRTHFETQGVIELAALPQLATVTTLELRDTHFDDAGVAILATSPYLTALETLDLCHNSLSDMAAEALAASSHLPALRTLYVGGQNRISATGQHLLCQKRPQIEVHVGNDYRLRLY